MRRWFRSQPIHRKLVLTSMVKTTVVLFAAMVVLLALDASRFHDAARADVTTLTEMVAENLRAALTFGDQPAIEETLNSLRRRSQVQRGCVYDTAKTLVAKFTRGEFSCPPSLPGPQGRYTLAATVPVVNKSDLVGYVYVDRNWVALRDRLLTAAMASLLILIIAAGVMLLVSDRLHRNISQPISELASAASRMGQDNAFQMPVIKTADDEVGQLVTAFGAMAHRVRSINDDLSRSNDALRREIDDRAVIQQEREGLLEREREANRIKDEFLATVSHELRTPLNAIVGWSQILVSTTPDATTVAKAAASLHRNAQAQSRVIDDLIDISRIVTGKLRVITEPLDLRAVVGAAVDEIRPAASHVGISLIVAMPENACVIKGDRDRLRQIVWNLLSNAVKFAPGGVVRVTISQESSQLRLTVSDTGVGIAPEFQAHVFDRFRQADSSITRQHGGLGIGLAVVKELVDLHGGAISVTSGGRGTGAAFSVLFPAIEAPVALEMPEERTPSLTGLSVLAVDDNADSLDVLKAILGDAGASYDVAGSADEALQLWRERPPDVVLCDLAMPGMSGFQLLEQIRELDRLAGRVTPAIAVTAHASEEQIARSAQAGFQNHVAKPFDSSELVRAISAARMRV
ncbi:MAG TPA: ATP-binding protein [Vicinamibacterales bacterium]|nr:ATP-binding protein [Vicinamibacterales bacterium]